MALFINVLTFTSLTVILVPSFLTNISSISTRTYLSKDNVSLFPDKKQMVPMKISLCSHHEVTDPELLFCYTVVKRISLFVIQLKAQVGKLNGYRQENSPVFLRKRSVLDLQSFGNMH
jgi:hypothetical protein